ARAGSTPRRNTTAPATPPVRGSTAGAWGLGQGRSGPVGSSDRGLTGARNPGTLGTSPSQFTRPTRAPAAAGPTRLASSGEGPPSASAAGGAASQPIRLTASSGASRRVQAPPAMSAPLLAPGRQAREPPHSRATSTPPGGPRARQIRRRP